MKLIENQNIQNNNNSIKELIVNLKENHLI